MAITFDGATKRIILDSTSVSAATIWSRWVDWHESNPEWLAAFRQVGGDSLGSGLYIPPYFFLLNGWRVRPMEAHHDLLITGNLFVDGGGIPVVRTIGTYQVNVNYTVPVQAQAFSTSGGTGPTPSEIAAAVWADVSAQLILTRTELADKVLKNTKIMEKEAGVWYINIYDDDGTTLLLSKPLKDYLLQNITDLPEGVLAAELASIV